MLFGVVMMFSVGWGGLCGGWEEFETVWAAGRGRRTAAESLTAGVLKVGLRGDERMVWRVMLWGYGLGVMVWGVRNGWDGSGFGHVRPVINRSG